MGIGMVIAVDKADANKAMDKLAELNEQPVALGRVVEGEGVIL